MGTTSTPAPPAIPIATATVSTDDLILFPPVQPGDYAALAKAGTIPPYDTTKLFKDWVDPNALTAPATSGPDPLTGIWYMDAVNVLYPTLSWSVGAGGVVTVTPGHLLITRAEAAAFNLAAPTVENLGFAPGAANVVRPVPMRPLQPCESLVPEPLGMGVLVQNNTIAAQQQAQAATAAAAAAATPVVFNQRAMDMLTWLCANAGAPNVTRPNL
jgi:hypothetical protein